jgi:GNAT superfamily N-acetyltransferase
VALQSALVGSRTASARARVIIDVVRDADLREVADFERRNRSDAPIRRLDGPHAPEQGVHVMARDGDGQVVATALLGDASLMGADREDALLSVLVDRERRGQGIGGQVLSAVEELARAQGRQRARSAAYADLAASLEFATKHGYDEVGRRTRWSLDLSRFDRRRFPTSDDVRAVRHIELLSWGEVCASEGASDELISEMWVAHHELLVELGSGLEPQVRNIGGYRELLEALMLVPEASFVARHRGRVVGLALFCAGDREWAHAAVIGSIGRGRAHKLAIGLKVRALNALADLGFRKASLLFDVDNAPTRVINQLLGFEPERTLVMLSKRLRRAKV